MMLVVIRFGCQLPIPGIETTFFKDWFAKQTADVLDVYKRQVVGNGEHSLINIGKAGRKRHMGIRPTVRGSVMNPNDHPHGGGAVSYTHLPPNFGTISTPII